MVVGFLGPWCGFKVGVSSVRGVGWFCVLDSVCCCCGVYLVWLWCVFVRCLRGRWGDLPYSLGG